MDQRLEQIIHELLPLTHYDKYVAIHISGDDVNINIWPNDHTYELEPDPEEVLCGKLNELVDRLEKCLEMLMRKI